MTDEDFNCSSVCDGNAHGPSHTSAATPGVTSPLYVATPFDHDYAKRKTLRRQQWAQQQQRHEEQQADGTVPVLDSVPGGGGGSLPFLHWDKKPTGGRSDCLMAVVSVPMIPAHWVIGMW